MRIARVWSAMTVGAALLATGGLARAETATCEVPVIQASPGGGATQIDPKIDKLKPYLTRDPFTSWHDFRLVDRKEAQLTENGSTQFALPNNRSATLTFLGHTAGPGEHRMRLKLVIDNPAKQHRSLDTTFVLDEGGVVLQVGQKRSAGDNSIIILGVSCKTSH